MNNDPPIYRDLARSFLEAPQMGALSGERRRGLVLIAPNGEQVVAIGGQATIIGEPSWLQLREGVGLYLPGGTAWRLHLQSFATAGILFGLLCDAVTHPRACQLVEEWVSGPAAMDWPTAVAYSLSEVWGIPT